MERPRSIPKDQREKAASFSHDPSAKLAEWTGHGWRATAWKGGVIASQPDLLALKIKIANAVGYVTEPRGPIGNIFGRPWGYCPPCREAPLQNASAVENSSIVIACCPVTGTGKHVHAPDAVFLSTRLGFLHESGVSLNIDPEDVVRGCMFDATDPDLAPLEAMPPRVKSQHAERWKARKFGSDSSAVRELDWGYDWTFSTRWWGCPTLNGVALEGFEDPDGELPMDLLTARDEILWYQELEQYADDLGDEGDATYTIRARVMPGFFFVLARLDLRVCNVIIRQLDTRWFHVFGSKELLREWSWRELTPDELRPRLVEPRQDLGPALLQPKDTTRRYFHRFFMP